MKMSIEIITRDDESTDYLAEIVKLLNKKFTTQEQMTSRWEVNCLEVAQELGGKIVVGNNIVVFDFSKK